MNVNFVIEGGDELQRNLATLGSRVEKRVIRQAVREAQKILLAAAKSSASALGRGPDQRPPDMSELIAKNLIIRAPKKQQAHSYSLNVLLRRQVAGFYYYARGARSFVNFAGGKRDIGKTVGVSYIPAAIEYGHLSGGTYVPATPFMRPAFEAAKNDMTGVFTEQLRIGLLREAIKARSE
jgi:hypothetical protein